MFYQIIFLEKTERIQELVGRPWKKGKTCSKSPSETAKLKLNVDEVFTKAKSLTQLISTDSNFGVYEATTNGLIGHRDY